MHASWGMITQKCGTWFIRSSGILIAHLILGQIHAKDILKTCAGGVYSRRWRWWYETLFTYSYNAVQSVSESRAWNRFGVVSLRVESWRFKDGESGNRILGLSWLSVSLWKYLQRWLHVVMLVDCHEVRHRVRVVHVLYKYRLGPHEFVVLCVTDTPQVLK